MSVIPDKMLKYAATLQHMLQHRFKSIKIYHLLTKNAQKN